MGTAALALCGCGLDMNGEEDNASMVNAPPKPPSCPDITELANITLSSGEFADVRIIRDRNLTLYIPTNWFEGRFVASSAEHPILRAKGNNFDPFISKDECPGIIHQANPATEAVFGFALPRTTEPITAMPSNLPYNGPFTRVGIGRVSSIRSPVRPEERFTDRIISWPTNETPSAYIAVQDGAYLIRYAWPAEEPMGSRKWHSYREAAIEMFNWLSTPPCDRDNHITLLNLEV